MDKFLTGDTRHFTFSSSGNSFSPMFVAILHTHSDTLITSASMTSSGPGYYANVTMPNTPDFYTVHFEGTNGGQQYKRRIRIQTVYGNVT